LVLTAVAYLWMNQLSKLPEPERIFARPKVGSE